MTTNQGPTIDPSILHWYKLPPEDSFHEAIVTEYSVEIAEVVALSRVGLVFVRTYLNWFKMFWMQSGVETF